MKFDDDAGLDTSEVQDRRGGSGAGGGFGGLGGLPGGGKTVGGGLAALIAVIAAVVFGVDPQLLGLTDGTGATQAGSTAGAAQLAQTCRTGADANARQDCRIVGVVNSVQAYWPQALAAQRVRYTPA